MRAGVVSGLTAGAAGLLAFSALPAQSVPEAPPVPTSSAQVDVETLSFPSIPGKAPAVRLEALTHVRDARLRASTGALKVPRSGVSKRVRSLGDQQWTRLNRRGSVVEFELSGYRLVNRNKLDQWRPDRLVLRGDFRDGLPDTIILTDRDRDGLWRSDLGVGRAR